MVVYRRAKPEEREAYIQFADMVFTDSGDVIHFDQSIPKVYAPGVDSAWMQNIAVDDEKGIRGLVAVQPGVLYAGGEEIKTGYIGTVSVHPEARGEGHMKKLMAMSMEQMIEDGVDAAFLNGRRQRYEYFGYAYGGCSYNILITKACVQHALSDVNADGVSFVEMNQESEWVDEAANLHDGRYVHCLREREKFVDICRTYLNKLWAVLKDGAFIGYFVANGDGTHVAEICMKNVRDVDAAIKAWILRNDVNLLSLSVPGWDRPLMKHLNAYAEGASYGPNGQVCVLNFRKVIRAMLKVKAGYAKLCDGTMALDIEGDRFTVVVRDNEIEICEGGENAVSMSKLEFNRLLAYPFDYEGRPNAPEGWFPLPFCFTAPDKF